MMKIPTETRHSLPFNIRNMQHEMKQHAQSYLYSCGECCEDRIVLLAVPVAPVTDAVAVASPSPKAVPPSSGPHSLVADRTVLVVVPLRGVGGHGAMREFERYLSRSRRKANSHTEPKKEKRSR